MPLARSTIRVAPLLLFVAAFVSPLPGRSAAPVAQPTPSKSPPPTEVEVRCVDDSVIKLKIVDSQLELVTRYGTLQVPVADIRRIEFATRTPQDVAERVTNLISNLNHPDFEVRERVMVELRSFRERAYLPLLKAIKHEDPEISRRAEETVRYLQQKLPAGQLEPRENDVIHTEDSKITGRLSAVTVRVQTFQFGEQALRVADVRTLRSASGSSAEDLANAPVERKARSPRAGRQGAGVWGTDVYSLDSNIGAAAVHAGVVTPGQSAAVRLRIVASPPQYVGSIRNGVGSSPYGTYPAGGFEFIRK